MNTKSILDRADSWLADYPDPDPILAAPDLIRDMRDYIAGMEHTNIEALKADLRFDVGLASVDCGCERPCCCREFSKGMEAVIDKVERHLGKIKLLPAPPKPENNDGD